MVKIYYNSQDVFDGVSPTPYVGIETVPVFLANRWCSLTKLTLEGTIFSDCSTAIGDGALSTEGGDIILTEGGDYISLSENYESPFTDIYKKKSLLIYRLSKEFKNFSIEENGVSVFDVDVARVVGVEFSSSKWGTSLNYTITLECYKNEDFYYGFGIIEPVNEINFSSSEDRKVTVTHRISAKGVKVSSSHPLDNAKNYVNSISPIDGFQTLFNGTVNSSMSLLSVEEVVNRFDNSYSVLKTYVYDPDNSSVGILRYTISISENINGNTSVSLSGSIQGGHNHTISQLRNRYTNINFYNIAKNLFLQFYPSEQLNQIPTSKEVSEDVFNNVINFSFDFDNSSGPQIVRIDKTSVSMSSDGSYSVSASMTLKWRGSCICNNEHGWKTLLSIAQNLNLFSQASSKWYFYGGRIPLKSTPSVVSKTLNKEGCEITVSQTFDVSGSGRNNLFEDIDYTINVSPAIPMFTHSNTVGSSKRYIQRLDYDRRATVTISGSAIKNRCVNTISAKSALRSYINNLAGIYVKGTNKILENGEIEESKDGNSFNFSFTWTSNAPREFFMTFSS